MGVDMRGGHWTCAILGSNASFAAPYGQAAVVPGRREDAAGESVEEGIVTARDLEARII
jgi:hypothetical protein